jgi:radical SAM protein with 4Fe4S-binding SPASM domain
VESRIRHRGPELDEGGGHRDLRGNATEELRAAVNALEMGFDAAWEQIRAETAKIRTPAKCVSCGYKEICGACAAVYYTETGAFDRVPEYVCRRAEAIVKATQAAYEERKQK